MDVLKYNAPDCSGALPRKRLAWVADALPRHRLALIIAGAGYGKTTLAARAFSRLASPRVWIRSEEIGDDLSELVIPLDQEIRARMPAFHWPDGHMENDRDTHDPQLAADRFARKLTSALTEDFFVIIEDCQALSPGACVFFQVLLDRFIPFFHLVLVGRTLPQMRFSRLAAREQILRISGTDLAFSREETGRFLGQRVDLPVPERDMDLLWHKTRGWVSGLVLFDQMTAVRHTAPLGGRTLGDAIAGLKGSHGLIRDYFMENVYDGLTPELRIFLVKTAVLGRLNAEFCNRFLEIGNARNLLCRLEEETGFIRSEDDDRDRFDWHPLFREFLEDRIPSELGEAARNALHTRAAGLYEAGNLGCEALTHHILGGNVQAAAGLMTRFARPVIKQERPLMLKSLLSVIPAQYMDDEPWFQYLQAGYFGLCSRLTHAVSGYEKVLKVFRRQADDQGECLVLMELAEHYLAAGRISASEQAYVRILAKDRLNPYLTIIVMGELVRVLALAGSPKRADKYADRALRLLDQVYDPVEEDICRAWIYTAQGYRHAFSGNYERALALAGDARKIFPGPVPDPGLGMDRLYYSAHFLIAYACFYLGRFETGIEAARQGLRLARAKGTTDEFTEFLRLMLAKNGLEQTKLTGDDLDLFIREIKKSRDYFESSTFPAGLAQAFLVLHRARLAQGDPSAAEDCLRRGLSTLRDIDMPLIRNELKAALSELLLYGDSGDRKGEAFELLKAAEQDLIHSGWHMAWISKIFARHYWNHGHHETAYKYMVYSLKICEEEGFDTWMLKEKDWMVPILTSLYAMGSMPSYIETLVVRMGNAALQDLHSLTHHRKKAIQKAAGKLLSLLPQPDTLPLTASFFGRFSLFVGERQIRADQWKSRKALTLLKYLLAMGKRGYIEKEILMELLWPEEDPKRSSQRFHVALAAVRKTLEPDIPKGVRSAYIKRSGQAYRVEITSEGRVDLYRFARLVREGNRASDRQTAMACFAEARDLYRGDFLEEDVYESWCMRERTRYKSDYLGVIKKLIAFHESERDYPRAIAAADVYLDLDPYAEEVVRHLMRLHWDAGNSPMVSRVFRNFSRAVDREFGCGVSPKTRDLYQRLSRPRQDVWDTRMLESFKIPGSL